MKLTVAKIVDPCQNLNPHQYHQLNPCYPLDYHQGTAPSATTEFVKGIP